MKLDRNILIIIVFIILAYFVINIVITKKYKVIDPYDNPYFFLDEEGHPITKDPYDT